MPAPPDESEPAMVSAIGIVIVGLATCSGSRADDPVLARRAIGSKLA